MSIVKSDTLPRLAKRKSDTSFDRIFKYIYTPKKRVELSPKEQELKERWDHIWDLLCGDILTDRQAVLRHKEKYPSLNERTCYIDLHNAKKLFGNGRTGTKEQKKAVVNEWLTHMINKAKEEGDYKAADKLILRYSRINGLDASENPFEAAIQNQKPVTVNITASPDDLLRAAEELMKGVPDTVDIPYQDVDEED